MNQAKTYYKIGRFFADKEDYDLAINALNKAINFEPECANAYCIRGSCYFEKEMFDKAIIDIDKAIDIKPETSAFYFNRGLTYFNLNKGESYSELGKFSEAERNFKEVALFGFLEELLWKKVVLLAEED